MYIDMDCACKGKNLDKLIQPLVLSILAQGGSMHGFAILKEMAKNERFDGKAPDATGVYRYLKKMETSGLLTSEWDLGSIDESGKPKRIFTITELGRECLENWAIALTDYVKYINGIVESIENSL